MKSVAGLALFALLLVSVLAAAGSKHESADEAQPSSDRDLARLLVDLELRTRAVIAKHYVNADGPHRDWLAENLLLPAAVADNVFHEVVPEATEGRAWVKMIVDEPRNPHNAGDAITPGMLKDLRTGADNVERQLKDAYYYGKPIRAAGSCLTCHGSPKGDPDPYFPDYSKNGWVEGQIVGAVIARVATSAHD